MKRVFDAVLALNKEYAKAVKDNAPQGVQETLLAGCDALFTTMILEAGLLEEYSYYCKKRISK